MIRMAAGMLIMLACAVVEGYGHTGAILWWLSGTGLVIFLLGLARGRL